MNDLVVTITQFIVNIVHQFGYIGIIFAMAIESSLLPLPSEIVMIPAGVLVKHGKMNFILVVLSGVLGSYLGSLANYLLADFLGRPLILKYGKYFLLPEEKLHKIEKFFEKYGSISIFIGRLLPIVRHFISIPAGFAKMNIYLFTLYTFLGSAIWMIVLTAIGYYLGDSSGTMHSVMPVIKFSVIAFCLIISTYYFYKVVYKNKRKSK